jgi:hypothetical protein
VLRTGGAAGKKPEFRTADPFQEIHHARLVHDEIMLAVASDAEFRYCDIP